MKKIVIILVIALFFMTEVYSQNYKQLKGFEYKEVICGNPIGDKEPPVLFVMHFSGGKPEILINYFANFDFPVKVIFIIGEYRFEDGFSYYPQEYYDETFTSREKTKIQKRVTKKIKKFIWSFLKINKVKSKTAIIGASQGGDLSILLSVNYPELFDLAIPIAATIESNSIFRNPRNKSNVSIKLIHGTEDPIVHIESIRKINSILKSKNHKTELREYEGKKHEISEEMIQDYTNWLRSIN